MPSGPLTTAILTLMIIGLAERRALAYLDPGAGSLLLQVFLGGFAALGVAARLLWRRLRTRRGRLAGRKADCVGFDASCGPRAT